MEDERQRYEAARAELARVRTEEEYLRHAVDTAMQTGWVRPEKKGLLVERYLKPIFARYLRVVAELGQSSTNAEEREDILRKLNGCLESTWRIGSTEHANILRSLSDAVRRSRDDVTEYALMSFKEEVARVLEQDQG